MNVHFVAGVRPGDDPGEFTGWLAKFHDREFNEPTREGVHQHRHHHFDHAAAQVALHQCFKYGLALHLQAR
ncbi:hypothetical protein D3C75_596000 [compost metagenome]